jgi:hypothetical protein
LGGIVIGSQFHDIESNDVKGLEFLQERDESLEGKASGFGRAHSREKAGIDHIEIEGDINRTVLKAPYHGFQGFRIRSDN